MKKSRRAHGHGSRGTKGATSMKRENEGRPCPICRRVHFKAGMDHDKAYHRYIGTRCWKRLRLGVFRKAGWTCEECGASMCMLHAHHLSYDRLGSEAPEDLVALCVKCHDAIHANRAGDRRERALRTFASRRWGKGWKHFMPMEVVEEVFDTWIESVKKRPK